MILAARLHLLMLELVLMKLACWTDHGDRRPAQFSSLLLDLVLGHGNNLSRAFEWELLISWPTILYIMAGPTSLAWSQFTVGPPLTPSPVTMLDHLSSCQRLAWRLHLWRSTIMTQLASVSAFQRLSSSVWLFCCIGSLSTWTCVILEWKPWRSLGSFMTFYNNDTTSVHECLSAPVSACQHLYDYVNVLEV